MLTGRRPRAVGNARKQLGGQPRMIPQISVKGMCDALESFEKQNRLQMSQVFPFRASMIEWALLFKDSMSGTEERVKLPDSHTNCKCTHRSKTKRCPPPGIAWTFTPS